MNRKQCSRMFEQMQPPQEAVRMLHQKIEAEARSQSRSVRKREEIIQNTVVSRPAAHPWKWLAGGMTAGVLLLGTGVTVGYHVNQNRTMAQEMTLETAEATAILWEEQDALHSEETAMTQISLMQTETEVIPWNERTEAERYDELLYNGMSWYRIAELPDAAVLGECLTDGEDGYLMGWDEHNTIRQSVAVPVYAFRIGDTEQRYAVAVELDDTYYYFTRSLSMLNLRYMQELPVIENDATCNYFSFATADGEQTCSELPADCMQPLFAFLQENGAAMNVYTGLSVQAPAEEGRKVSDAFCWDYRLSLQSAFFEEDGMLYFDCDTGMVKAFFAEEVAYFAVSPDAVVQLLADLKECCEAAGITAVQALDIEIAEDGTITYISSAASKDISHVQIDMDVETLRKQMLTAHQQFKQVSGGLYQENAVYADDRTIEQMLSPETVTNTGVVFQIDLQQNTKNVYRNPEITVNWSVPKTAPEDKSIVEIPHEQLVCQTVQTNDTSYVLYPDLGYYQKCLVTSYEGATAEDMDVQLLLGNGLENGILYMKKAFSDTALEETQAQLTLFGTVRYLERNCYILLVRESQTNVVTRYLIDREYGIALKKERVGEDGYQLQRFSQIQFDADAEPVPEVDEATLLEGLEPLPDYLG